MKQTPENIIVTVTLPKEIQEKVVEIAKSHDWSIAKTGRHLIKLGLDKLSEDQKGNRRASKRITPALI